MKARISKIESGRDYIDKQRRITLTFEDGSAFYGNVTAPEGALKRSLSKDWEPKLDQEFTIDLILVPVMVEEAAL